MGEVVMPRLSDTMEQGTIAKWLKRQGEQVSKGEPLVEIETDKANMVLDAYESGVLERIIVSEGQTVPIGEPIASIAEQRAVGGPATAAVNEKPRPPAETQAPSQIEAPAREETSREAPKEAPEEESETRLKVSPIARRIAQEHDVDLEQVSATGPGGRITKEDVEAFLRQREGAAPRAAARPAPPPAAAPLPALAPPAPPAERAAPPAERPKTVELTRMQSTIARRMVESKTSVPHFYTTTEVGMDTAARLRDDLNATIGSQGSVGFNDLIIRATALALVKYPEANASYVDGQIEFHQAVNVGIAVALPQGLVVPVLRDAARKHLLAIAREARELIQKARDHHLAPAEWEGATFTISNLGMFDVDEFAAIITPPQAAILAVSSIKPVPVVAEGQVTVGQRMKMTLSADHRVFYGATAAEFLRELKRLLEQPLSLLL